MRIELNKSALHQTRWSQYAVRFLFGGLITALAGVIADKCGPAVAGLCLAFPAIFPASATLIERHERERKSSLGLNGVKRGRLAAAADAAGATMGSAGMLVFAAITYYFLPTHPSWSVLTLATIAWVTVSLAVWRVSKAI